MTAKDFVAIAGAVKDARDAANAKIETSNLSQVFDSMAKSLAKVLATTNPKFDRARFLAACGVK